MGCLQEYQNYQESLCLVQNRYIVRGIYGLCLTCKLGAAQHMSFWWGVWCSLHGGWRHRLDQHKQLLALGEKVENPLAERLFF